MALQDPAGALLPLSRLGGFDTKYVLNGQSVVGKGLHIIEDKPITVLGGVGGEITYPTGTFNTNTLYPIQTQKIVTSELSVNAIYIYIEV